jgi:hypothetical protein
MKKESSSHLDPEAIERLQELAAMADASIDTSDAPEVLDWTGAKRGLFHGRASGHDQIAVGLNSQIFAWFREHSEPGEDVESRINRVLSEHIAGEMKKAS